MKQTTYRVTILSYEAQITVSSGRVIAVPPALLSLRGRLWEEVRRSFEACCNTIICEVSA